MPHEVEDEEVSHNVPRVIDVAYRRSMPFYTTHKSVSGGVGVDAIAGNT